MDDWQRDILGALRDSRIFIACLSPNYLTSAYCGWECSEFLNGEIRRGFVGDGIAVVYTEEIGGWFTGIYSSASGPNSAWIEEVRRRHLFDLREWFARPTQLSAEVAFDAFSDRIAARAARADRATYLAGVDAYNPYFTGRRTEFAQIREAFLTPSTVGGFVVVRGLGGMGKTALAVAYAHTHAYEYGGCVWQARCEKFTDLREPWHRLPRRWEYDLPTMSSRIPRRRRSGCSPSFAASPRKPPRSAAC
jgi:hypothetical protein